jgi:hypothetical protein
MAGAKDINNVEWCVVVDGEVVHVADDVLSALDHCDEIGEGQVASRYREE